EKLAIDATRIDDLHVCRIPAAFSRENIFAVVSQNAGHWFSLPVVPGLSPGDCLHALDAGHISAQPTNRGFTFTPAPCSHPVDAVQGALCFREWRGILLATLETYLHGNGHLHSVLRTLRAVGPARGFPVMDGGVFGLIIQ